MNFFSNSAISGSERDRPTRRFSEPTVFLKLEVSAVLAASPRCRCRGVNEMRELRCERGSMEVLRRFTGARDNSRESTLRAGKPSRTPLLPLVHLASTSTGFLDHVSPSLHRVVVKYCPPPPVLPHLYRRRCSRLTHPSSPPTQTDQQRSTSYSRSGPV
jgi:hypothetical protein